MKPEGYADKAEDLFSTWRQELMERQEIRISQLNPADMVLNQPEDVELLVRAWFYHGRSFDLFVAIFHNLHKMPIIKRLITSPQVIIQGFLEFLPWYILVHRPRPVQLQFLVSLYRDELASSYSAIIDSLTPDASQYLLSRTANPALRRLLKKSAQADGEELFRFMPERLPDNHLSGLYGNKNQCLLRALQVCRASPHDGLTPYGTDNLLRHLETAEAVFEGGLIADSMAILLKAYEVCQHPVDVLQDIHAFKRFARVLRKVGPSYAMVEHTPAALAAYRSIYSRYFRRFEPSASTDASLVLLERLLSDSPSEAAIIASLKLWKLHIDEEFPGSYQPWWDDQGGLNMKLVQNYVDSQKQSQPQEAFTLMLAALWIKHNNGPGLSTDEGRWILDLCQELWVWAPSQVFFNARLWAQLSRFVSSNDRPVGERLLSRIGELQGDGLRFEIENRPDLFKQRDRLWERNILAGAFLGVR